MMQSEQILSGEWRMNDAGLSCGGKFVLPVFPGSADTNVRNEVYRLVTRYLNSIPAKAELFAFNVKRMLPDYCTSVMDDGQRLFVYFTPADKDGFYLTIEHPTEWIESADAVRIVVSMVLEKLNKGIS